MTHEELVERAVRWLHSHRCMVVVADMEAASGERVDAMGWGGGRRGWSTLVECKASRSDFHCDKRKPWRVEPAIGVGLFRYYMAPAGVLSPEDMPPGWGLIVIGATGRARRTVKATPQPEANRAAETWLLTNACRAVRNGLTGYKEWHKPLAVQGGQMKAVESAHNEVGRHETRNERAGADHQNGASHDQ